MKFNSITFLQAFCKNAFLGFSLFLLSNRAFSQKNLVLQDYDRGLKQAIELYHNGLYSNAQPLFKDYMEKVGYFDATEHQLSLEDAKLYYIVCAFKLNQPQAVADAEDYIRNGLSLANRETMSYELAHFYFQKKDFKTAAHYFGQTDPDNFPEGEKNEVLFEKAYSYFNIKEFDKAYPLFNSINDPQNQYYVPAKYYAGYIALSKKEYDQALRSFQEIVHNPKYDLVVPYYITEIYYHQGQYDKLLDYALPYVKKGNLYYDADLRHLVGKTYFEKGLYKEAIPYLSEYEKEAKSLQKGDVYELAYSYYQTGQLEQAISGFKQLSNGTDSLAQNSMYLLGDCYLKTGQKEEARQAFAFSSRSTYNEKQQEISRFNYGKLSYELGYQDVALKSLQDFLNEYPKSEYQEEAREILAELFMNTADYKNALAILKDQPKEASSMQKAYQRVTFGRAMQLINDGQLPEADQLLVISLQYPVDNSIASLANFWRGEVAFRKGDYDQAISFLNNYLSLGSTSLGEANSQTAQYNLGYSYLKKGQYQAAITHFKGAQNAFGTSGARIANDALLREADCYYMLKDYAAATRLYDQAIQKGGPGSDYALYQKGIISGIGGDDQQKITLLDQLSAQHPNSNYTGEADYQIGSTYMNQGDYEKAISYFEKIIAEPNNPNVAKAKLKLASAYANLNQGDKAAVQFKQIINQYKNSPEAAEALNSLKSLYINEGQPNSYFEFLKAIGRPVTVSTEDSLTYASAEASFGALDYPKAIDQFTAYLSRFPEGEFSQKAYFYRAESENNTKDYSRALNDYEEVLKDGIGVFAEPAAEQASSISFYQEKDYARALQNYQKLKDFSTTKENTLTALRGILRSHYELQNWNQVKAAAKDLLNLQDISTGDQIVCYFYTGRADQEQGQYDDAISQYQQAANLTTSELGAESRYYIAESYYQKKDFKKSEESAFDVIKNTPSYDYWVAKSYILLGEVFWKEGDYFNSKATLQSIVDHSNIKELVAEAQSLLRQVKEDEQKHSKITN